MEVTRLFLTALLALHLGCVATVTTTDDVTSVTWAVGAATVTAGPECAAGEECSEVVVSGGHAGKDFLSAILSPAVMVLRAVMGGM